MTDSSENDALMAHFIGEASAKVKASYSLLSLC